MIWNVLSITRLSFHSSIRWMGSIKQTDQPRCWIHIRLVLAVTCLVSPTQVFSLQILELTYVAYQVASFREAFLCMTTYDVKSPIYESKSLRTLLYTQMRVVKRLKTDELYAIASTLSWTGSKTLKEDTLIMEFISGPFPVVSASLVIFYHVIASGML